MLDKELLRERVVKEILARIAQGAYPPGSRLPAERRLSEEFRISRGTLREGLLELARMGVLDIRHGSGAHVKGLGKGRIPKAYRTPECDGGVSLGDVILAWKAIELPAIRLACEKMPPSLMPRLERLLAGMTGATVEPARFIDLDMEFHRSIVCAGGNKVLLAAFDAIHRYHRFSQVFTSYGTGELEQTVGHHAAILRAIRQGRPAAAQRALASHLDDMQRYQTGGASDGRTR